MSVTPSTTSDTQPRKGNPVSPERVTGVDAQTQKDGLCLDKQADEVRIDGVADFREGETSGLPRILHMANEQYKRSAQGQVKESDPPIGGILFEESNQDLVLCLQE